MSVPMYRVYRAFSYLLYLYYIKSLKFGHKKPVHPVQHGYNPIVIMVVAVPGSENYPVQTQYTRYRLPLSFPFELGCGEFGNASETIIPEALTTSSTIPAGAF